MSEIILFKGENCAPCKQLKEYLDKENIAYSEKNMIEHLTDFKLNGVMRVPTLVKIDESGSEVDRVIGFDINKIKELINA